MSEVVLRGTGKHRWTPGRRNKQPVLLCTNKDCRMVWWPDRNNPSDNCPYQKRK